VQVAAQLLDLNAWTFGGHDDRAHTDHDLAGWSADVGNFDPTSGEADVNAPSAAGFTAGYAELIDRGLVLQRHFVIVQREGSGRDAATAR
jgi:hypothetical protein